MWLWRDGEAPPRTAGFTGSMFWPVLPSLLLWLVTPVLLRGRSEFWPGLAAGNAATTAAHALGVWTQRRWIAA